MSSEPLLNSYSSSPPNSQYWSHITRTTALLQAEVSLQNDSFIRDLRQPSTELKAKIEKDMTYLSKTFEDCAYLIQFQDSFFHDIDRSLQQTRENTNQLKAALQKSSSQASCQQKILNCIITALGVIILILVGLVFVKIFFTSLE
jgi:t-SNARE complex subunit (syntaxin)